MNPGAKLAPAPGDRQSAWRSTLAALCIVVVGLAGRSALDKVLALRGGAPLVALWAQLASVMEMVWGPALSGIGTGVAVLAAQRPEAGQRAALLREAVRLGLAVAAAMLLAVLGAAALFPGILGGAQAPRLQLAAAAAAAGWAATVGGVVNGYWMGARENGKMLGLAAAGALAPLAVALLAAGLPPGRYLAAVAFAHALPAAILAPFLPWRRPAGAPRLERRLLQTYLLPGFAIGILSPASLLAARALVSSRISWGAAGELQAIWRASDWVASLAGGVLALHFLPRMSAAADGKEFARVTVRAMLATVLPAAAAYAVFFLFQRDIFAALYDRRFVLPDAAVALFLAGSTIRIAAWAALFGLYARRQTRAIALGELLSLPLFALLLALWPGELSLVGAGAAWLLAYVAYLAFNAAALRSRRPSGVQ